MTKSRDRANQRRRFEEIDRLKAEQRALEAGPDIDDEEHPDYDFSRLRKDTIHIWKD